MHNLRSGGRRRGETSLPKTVRNSEIRARVTRALDRPGTLFLGGDSDRREVAGVVVAVVAALVESHGFFFRQSVLFPPWFMSVQYKE